MVNCKTGAEIWISRRFIGEISRIDDPVVIVGLTKELEFKAGSVFPYQRRVIEMPLAVGGGFPPTGATDTPLTAGRGFPTSASAWNRATKGSSS